MRIQKASLPWVARSPDMRFALVWSALLLGGLLMYRDFGISWDEPLFYKYGEAVRYAYSPREWFSGSFNLERAYGPSAEDHKIYGAAYLLVARPIVRAIAALSGTGEPDAWHLVNFLTFMGGLLPFYFLCKRWMSPVAALSTTALLATQPLLWGQAFINPKDVPFLAVFLAAVESGFRMVDRAAQIGGLRSGDRVEATGPWRPSKRKTICILALAVAVTALALASQIGAANAYQAVRQLVASAYDAPRESTLGQLFAALASRADVVPVEAYVQKSWGLFLRARTALTALSLLALVSGAAVLFPDVTQSVLRKLDRILAPAPAKPTLESGDLRDWRLLRSAVLPGVLLGMLMSIRLVGFLAGGIVLLYYLLRPERRSLAPAIAYLAVASVVLLITWPYLWPSPVSRLFGVARHMADNPKVVPVLYRGRVLLSTDLPSDYLPRMLTITLTEPTLLFLLVGIVGSVLGLARRTLDWRSWIPILLWFLFPFAYVIFRRPAMYDGYRHFLFVLPPVFIAAGLALDYTISRIRRPAIAFLLCLTLILPGLVWIIRLHPYEYTYYNALVGGTGGAFRHYETDYWLTCYRSTVNQIANAFPDASNLYVRRQPALARQYAPAQLQIELYDPEVGTVPRGALLLLTTRTNVDQSAYTESPVLLTEGRDGAVFCLVKRNAE